MINSHLLYRLSYRGTTVAILLITLRKSTLPEAGVCRSRNRFAGCAGSYTRSIEMRYSTLMIASVTAPRLLWLSAAAQIRPVSKA